MIPFMTNVGIIVTSIYATRISCSFIFIDTDRPRSTSSIDRHFDHFIQSTANGGVNKHDRQESSSTEHLITPHSEPSNHRH